VGQGQGVFVSKHSKAIQKRRIRPMSTIPTTNETSNVTSLPSTSKTQTAKEVIAANASAMRCCAVFFMGIVSPIQKTCSPFIGKFEFWGV
jgi:hypothetical protein